MFIDRWLNLLSSIGCKSDRLTPGISFKAYNLGANLRWSRGQKARVTKRVAFQSVYKCKRRVAWKSRADGGGFDVVGARCHGKLISLPAWIDLNFKFERLIWQKPSDRSACRARYSIMRRICRGAAKLIEKHKLLARCASRKHNQIFPLLFFLFSLPSSLVACSSNLRNFHKPGMVC